MINWSATKPTPAPARMYAESQVRPLRLAVAIPEPISTRAFRRVVRALCDKWGGTTSLIVPIGKDLKFGSPEQAAIQAFDPDAVYLYRSASFKQLQKLRRNLDAFGATPFWVVRFSERLQGEFGWMPTSITEAAVEGSTVFTDPLHGAPPTTVAVLGLPVRTKESAEARALVNEARARASTDASVDGSPAAVASARAQRSTLVRLPFYYHRTDTLDDGITLWNLRAVRGLSGHGGDKALIEILERTPSRGLRRLEIVAGQPLTAEAEQVAAARGATVIVTSLSRLRWPRRPNRTPRTGRQSESDDVPIIDGRFELPVRRPAYAIPVGVAGGEPAGAYAVELDLQLPSDDDRRFGMPARSGLRNIVLSFRWDERPSDQARRLAVRSRVARDGSTVLAVRPSRVIRSVALSVPSVTEVLNRLGGGIRFELSDKGRFGQWTLNHLSGLDEVHATLTDVRSRVLIAEFQRHHLGSAITGSYRRSLTLDEMRRAFTQARRDTELPRRVPGGWTDESWLRAWVSRLVEVGVLQLGMRVKCVECLAGSLIRVGEYGQNYFCPRCGLNTRTPSMPEMGYQLNEAAFQFLSQRSDVTALALAAIRRRSVNAYTYGFDHIVRWQSGDVNEFDFAAIADGRLMIGESKTGAKFTDGDIRTLIRLARVLRPSTVVLSSDRECEGGCTANCSRTTRPHWASSDASLPRGNATVPGPRERMESGRVELAKIGIRLVALCRGDLYAPFARDRRRVPLV